MISVIVPVYNAENYIDECVRSVLTQSHKDLELILVDDGSTDGSLMRCDAYAASDSRVRVLRRENGGVSRARNTGLEAARGSVIAFLDCDDYILPGMYETLLEKMKSMKARIAVCTVFDEQNGGNIRKLDTGETILITGRDALRQLASGMGGRAGNRETIWFSVWNKLYDATLFREGGLRFDPETDSAEDVPVNLAAFALVDRIVYYEKPYYFWRHRAESQSNLRTPEALRGALRTSRYLFDNAKTLPEPDRAMAVTAAVRHFYWYYTACIQALFVLRGADGTGVRQPASAYQALRADMIQALGEIASDPAYKKYAAARFKAAVFLMIRTPGLFAVLWRCYRRARRTA